MTILELVDTYLHSIGLRRLKGDSASPLLPFFILDAMYSTLTSDLMPIPVKGKTKKALSDLKHNYNLVNRQFFRAYTQEQQDEIIDIMDAFSTALANDILITKVAVMNQLKRHGVPFEEQKILASAMLCNILAQQASIVWEEVFKHTNRYLAAIERNTKIWMQSYFIQRFPGHINPNDDEQICLAVDILCKKIIQFLEKL